MMEKSKSSKKYSSSAGQLVQYFESNNLILTLYICIYMCAYITHILLIIFQKKRKYEVFFQNYLKDVNNTVKHILCGKKTIMFLLTECINEKI